MERESIGDEADPEVAARLKELVANGQNNYGTPDTGTGPEAECSPIFTCTSECAPECNGGQTYPKDIIPRSYAGEPTLVDYNTPSPTYPVTGTGVNPLKMFMIDLPNPNPESIADYMAWVKLRHANLVTFIKRDEGRLALETLARLEGDLQRVRHLLKASGASVKRVIEG